MSKADWSALLKLSDTEVANKLMSGIRNTPNFKQVKSIFNAFLNNRLKDTGHTYTFVISEYDLNKLSHNLDIDKFNKAAQQALLHNDWLHFDNNLDLIESGRLRLIYPSCVDDNNQVRRLLSELTNTKKYVVFQLGSQGMIDFAEGTDDGNSIFYTESVRRAYEKKRDISEIEQVFEEYKHHLKKRTAYSKFFVTKTTIEAWFRSKYPKEKRKSIKSRFIIANKHILRNKPEDSFRDDLKEFLGNKIKNTFNFSKEHILSSLKRLDICTEDEDGNFYFIEIKWLGESVAPSDSEPGTAFDNNSLNPKAFEQVLGYIEEMQALGNFVKIGYLVVFDARANRLQDPDYYSDSLIDSKLHSYLIRFKRYPHFVVDNVHPN